MEENRKPRNADFLPTKLSVQFSRSVVSDSPWSHESQHVRPPCLSPTPRVHPDSCASSQWCHQSFHPLSSPSPPAPIPPSIRVFSNESTLRMRWPKYWSFSLSINPSNEHPGLASFRMDWLDLLAVQGTHKSLLQHYSSKASILRRSGKPKSMHLWSINLWQRRQDYITEERLSLQWVVLGKLDSYL